MKQQRELEDLRGLRFRLDAGAELVPEQEKAGIGIPGRVTELSFRGCFVETSAALREKQRVRVKIFHNDKHFEAQADVLYVRPNGVGLLFRVLDAHFREVLQAWILTAMDKQEKSKHR
jgi:PilZ domain